MPYPKHFIDPQDVAETEATRYWIVGRPASPDPGGAAAGASEAVLTMNLTLHVEDVARAATSTMGPAGRADRSPRLEAALPKQPPQLELTGNAVLLTVDQDVPIDMPWVLLVLPLAANGGPTPALGLDLDALYGDERELRRFWSRSRRSLGGRYAGPRTACFTPDEWRATAPADSDPERRLIVLLRQHGAAPEPRLEPATELERHDAERLALHRLLERTAGDPALFGCGLVRRAI